MVKKSRKTRASRRRRRGGKGVGKDGRIPGHSSLGRKPLAEPKVPPSEYGLRRRADALAKCIRLYPNEVVYGLARHEEAGWHFGRLFLIGAIDKFQYIAAERLDQATRRYKHLLNKYSLMKISNWESFGGASPEDLSPAASRRFQKVSKEYHIYQDALKECGPEVQHAVMEALDKDTMTDLGHLKRGLDVISRS